MTFAVSVTVGKNASCAQYGPLSQCWTQTSQHHLGQMLVAALTTAPLALRRIRPLTAFWVIAAAAVAAPHLAFNTVTMASAAVAAYSAVVYSRYRVAAVVCVPLAGLLVATAFPALAEPLRLPGPAAIMLGLLPVVYVGQAMRKWRRRVSESQARLDRLQAEHEAATALALATERARIASELHDVVTHNVSVMIVQAGAARQVLTNSPGAAKDALLAVESSGRAAMAELRHLLGLLSPDLGSDGAVHGADLQPQPGLDQLPALIGRVRAAGLEVALRWATVPYELPTGPGLAAYRVVQEGLTNVLKHAGRTRADVSVDYRDGSLLVEVVDAGLLERGPAGAPGPVPGAGRGLLGLRERVALYGGEVTAGPEPGGGWAVRARLPVEPSAAHAAPAAVLAASTSASA